MQLNGSVLIIQASKVQLQGIFHLPEEQRVKAAMHSSLSAAGGLRGLGT